MDSGQPRDPRAEPAPVARALDEPAKRPSSAAGDAARQSEARTHGDASATAASHTGTLPALAPPLSSVPFTRVRLNDSFFAPRAEINRTAVIPACWKKCAETGRFKNFTVAAGLAAGKHEGALYNDSDVYKLIEGIAYSLALHPDAELAQRTDGLIATIAQAQREDGYLNTYWQLVEPPGSSESARWTNIRHGHELYCAGHLIEAAVAYAQATGREDLLEVARANADHIAREFGPGKRLDPPGHPELELALIKLAQHTGEARYAELARFFIDQRGRKEGRELFGEYAQDHEPLREQRAIVGHAVRAMYLYSGAVDVANWFGDATLLPPMRAIWNDLVESKLYVTGGIGSSAANEGFDKPFELPNESAYCETCASIGMLLWNQRLFLSTKETRFADLVERELYNGIPAGLSLDGTRFFYDNPLASRGQHERVPWFDCSCCPTNLVRTLPSVGQYVYATDERALYVSQFIQSQAEIDVAGTRVRVTQASGLPWSGHVEFTFEPENPVRFALWLRVPDWAGSTSIVAPSLPASTPIDASLFPRDVESDGSHWKVLEREWRRGDKLAYDLALDVKRLHADERVEADRGRCALQHGPLIYAFEAADNGGRALDLVLASEKPLPQPRWRADLLGGTNVLEGKGERLRGDDPFIAITEPADLVAIPYCLWANRGRGEMEVWIAEDARRAERATAGVRLAHEELILRASHCFERDTLAALDDGALGKNSADESIPRFTFWPRRGSSEWVEIDFRAPRKLSKTAVQWFDDTGRGACRVPKSWRALYQDGAEWKPVAATAAGGVARDSLNTLEFAPVTTRALRLEIDLAPEVSAGLLEWRVE